MNSRLRIDIFMAGMLALIVKWMAKNINRLGTSSTHGAAPW